RARPEHDRRRGVSALARMGAARRLADAQGRAPRACCRRRAMRAGAETRGAYVRRMRGAPGWLAAAAVALSACAGGANAPQAPRADLPKMYADAFRVDALGDPQAAVQAHLGVGRAAARQHGDRWQVPALEASLDALTSRTMISLGEASPDAALVWRTTAGDAVAQELARVDGQGPFARGLVARALTGVAQRRGDAAEAEKQR